jgi:hypothetical protein
MNDDYRVYIVPLPRKIKDAVRLDETGFASIYISAALSHSGQLAALNHELRHLRRGDMYSSRSIRAVENL